QQVGHHEVDGLEADLGQLVPQRGDDVVDGGVPVGGQRPQRRDPLPRHAQTRAPEQAGGLLRGQDGGDGHAATVARFLDLFKTKVGLRDAWHAPVAPAAPVAHRTRPCPRAGPPTLEVAMPLARSIVLFAAAALLEIGGAWLVWQGVREHRGWAWIGAGVIALGLYGFVATLQPDAHFGRILAAYGGVFVVGSLLWGVVADGFEPDRWDVTGALLCLAGVAVIMYAPRPV